MMMNCWPGTHFSEYITCRIEGTGTVVCSVARFMALISQSPESNSFITASNRDLEHEKWLPQVIITNRVCGGFEALEEFYVRFVLDVRPQWKLKRRGKQLSFPVSSLVSGAPSISIAPTSRILHLALAD